MTEELTPFAQGYVDVSALGNFKLPGRLHTQTTVQWRDLDAFTQGYIEALFFTEDEVLGMAANGWLNEEVGFSDLAPETLAQIIADCARAQTCRQHQPGFTPAEQHGRFFWTDRQRGCQGGFPPLTVQLGDDGKVRFAKATGEGTA